MSLETELPLLEQCCTSATDFLDLLSQVTEDDELGNDRLLQHRLLDQAASLANGPSELMAVSDQALLSGRIPEAAEYFERAQAAAESSDEHMVIARALAARTDQGQVIHEAIAFHVRSAAKCVSRAVELTPILVFIHDELGDRALCQSVITDDLQALAGFNDFCALGRSLVAHPAAELARMVFERSSRLCNDMHSVIAYSKVLREQLHDPEAALAVLGDAEADCQTTEEFVELAQAYRDLDDTAEHVHELMELAEEFAIDLADRVHLARGRYLVQNDLNGALETYREIIPELMDAPPLIRVGHDLAFRLNAPEDALSAFTHALERVEDFEAHMALLNALTGDGESVPDGFRDFADQLCDRIVDRFHKTGQLTALAQYRGSVLNDPSGATRIVTRAVKGARDEQSLRELITVARTLGKASHAEYLAFERLGNMSYEAPTLLELADQARSALGHRKLTRALLEKAEANGRGPEQLEQVANAIERHFPMDALWVDNLRSDIQGRRQVEERLAELMDRLDTADTPEGILFLAHEAAVQFEDREVTRRCLERAEYGLLRESAASTGDAVVNLIALTVAVSTLVNDVQWTLRLIEESLPLCWVPRDTFRYCRGVLEPEGTDPDIAEHLAQQFRSYLVHFRADPDVGAYELLKAARAAHEIFRDTSSARDLLEDARSRTRDPLCLAQLALLARQMNDPQHASALLDHALSMDTGPESIARVCRLLRRQGMGNKELRELYGRGRDQSSPRASVRWIVGIDTLFGDSAWTRREFQALLGALPAGEDRTRVRRMVRDRAFQPF